MQFDSSMMSAKASFGAKPVPSAIKDTTTASFRQDVISESALQPVLVDFWAPWCGPCKQLGPIIEKAVAASNGKVKLVKMNIDDHPQIAGQLGIQSIPAVIAFDKGQPVDGFVGALPESQIKAFIDKLTGPDAAVEILAQALAEAELMLGSDDVAGAAGLYGAILAQDPENAVAIAGLVHVQLKVGAPDQARAILDAVSPDTARHPAIVAARAALDLAEQAAGLGELGELERRIADDPADLQARFDLAIGLNALSRRVDAVDQLTAILKAERSWSDDAARKQLLMFFEAWGPMDPASVSGRRKLSALLFA